MYQGGCGDLSLWGQQIIQGENQCKIWTNDGKDLHVGFCSEVGHCVGHSQEVSYNNPYCVAALIRQNRSEVNSEVNISNTFHLLLAV